MNFLLCHNGCLSKNIAAKVYFFGDMQGDKAGSLLLIIVVLLKFCGGRFLRLLVKISFDGLLFGSLQWRVGYLHIVELGEVRELRIDFP